MLSWFITSVTDIYLDNGTCKVRLLHTAQASTELSGLTNNVTNGDISELVNLINNSLKRVSKC